MTFTHPTKSWKMPLSEVEIIFYVFSCSDSSEIKTTSKRTTEATEMTTLRSTSISPSTTIPATRTTTSTIVINTHTTSIPRASGGRRLWQQRPPECGAVPSPSLRHLLHPWSASSKVRPQPLPPVWGEAGRLWGIQWCPPWLLHLVGGRLHQLDSPLHYEVPHPNYAS